MAKATAAQIEKQKKVVAQAEEQLKTAQGDEKPAFQKQLDDARAQLAELAGESEENEDFSVDFSAPPEEAFEVDDRTKELLRLINNGERNIAESLDQLIAASKGSKIGADALYNEVKQALGEMCKVVRNAAGHQAVAAKKAA